MATNSMQVSKTAWTIINTQASYITVGLPEPYYVQIIPSSGSNPSPPSGSEGFPLYRESQGTESINFSTGMVSSERIWLRLMSSADQDTATAWYIYRS